MTQKNTPENIEKEKALPQKTKTQILTEIRVNLSDSENPTIQKEAWDTLVNIGESGDYQAQLMLASYYEEGCVYTSPIKPDKERNLYWLEKAVESLTDEMEHGYYGLCDILSEIYSRKNSPLYSPEKSREAQRREMDMLLKEAEGGNIIAQVEVANCYIEGIHVEKNFEEARRWLEILEKECELGYMYLSIFGDLYRKMGDQDNAIRLYTQASLMGDDFNALCMATRIYEISPERAVSFMRQAAGDGNAHCQNGLGEYYLKKISNIPELPSARRYLNQSSDKNLFLKNRNKMLYQHAGIFAELWSSYFKALGNGEYDADAAYAIVTTYYYRIYSGFSTPDSADFLLSELAESANPHQIAAEVMLGCNSLNAGNQEKALFWFERSAQHGFKLAHVLIGSLYLDTASPLYDQKKAAYWLSKAKKEIVSFLFSIIETGLFGYDQFKNGLINQFLYLFIRGIKEITPWFIADADTGDAVSQFWIALRYLGKISPREQQIAYPLRGELNLDKALGIKYLKLSVAQGFAPAEFFLGKMMSYGKIIESELNGAETFLKKASEHGFDKIDWIDIGKEFPGFESPDLLEKEDAEIRKDVLSRRSSIYMP